MYQAGVRRFTGNMMGEPYMGNTHTKEVHDLDNETIDCQIGEILTAKHDRPYNSLEAAHADGYANCAHCLGGSTR